MRRYHVLLALLGTVLAVAPGALLVACDRGPEADLHLRRVAIVMRWDDPPSFRAVDLEGHEYDFIVTSETTINSDQAASFTFADIRLADNVEIWANKIAASPEPEVPRYQAIRIDCTIRMRSLFGG